MCECAKTLPKERKALCNIPNDPENRNKTKTGRKKWQTVTRNWWLNAKPTMTLSDSVQFFSIHCALHTKPTLSQNGKYCH